MITSNNTIERLREFKLPGFIEALRQQQESPHYTTLSFEDRLKLIVDYEYTRRSSMKAQRMLRAARIPTGVSLDDVEFSAGRGLKKELLMELLQEQWLRKGHNVIITGQTGAGKTFVSSVIGHSLCLKGVCVRYNRTHHWLADFTLQDERRRFPQSIAGYRKVPLIVFDEWLRDPISAYQARLLLDFIDDRYQRYSTMFVSQLPVSSWHARFEEPTLADAVLDRIIHTAIRIELTGESMRKQQAEKQKTSLRSDNLDGNLD
jgi:DNA replication protein DnaC